MEYLEEYDDECRKLATRIEDNFKYSKTQNTTKKKDVYQSIKRDCDTLHKRLTYFKSDLYLAPRAKEVEYRKKYNMYMEKYAKYEMARKQMYAVLNEQTNQLKELKMQANPERYGAGLN